MNEMIFHEYGFIVVFMTLVTPNGSDNLTETELDFPDDFLIGTASSAFQIEGAWNISGKSESIWDNFVHNQSEIIYNQSNADVSCDSYHKYKEDIKLMKDIGLDYYRFSISWARILPSGYKDSLNEEGLRYYHNVLDELEKHKIQPFVTIYHWDHPQSLERLGGWMNDLMIDFFADYARIIFREFGSRVKFFSTINEPYVYCIMGYRTAQFAPGLNLSGWGEYVCMHNMLKAHAVAYHIYDEEFRSKQNGQIGIVLPCLGLYNKYKNDLKSKEIAFEFNCGCIANPIFSKNGDYPEIMKRMIGDESKLRGRKKLPSFSNEWVQYIKGTADYFGLNHYTSYLVEPLSSTMNTLPSTKKNSTDHYQEIHEDSGLLYTQDERWPSSQNPAFDIVPEGFGDLLREIKRKYDNPTIYILELGVADTDIVNDKLRMRYLYSYMREMLIAINRDECNVKALTFWSFLDNFEWTKGYVEKFGLVSVDFNSPERKRTPKASVSWLKSVLKSRKLLPYE